MPIVGKKKPVIPVAKRRKEPTLAEVVALLKEIDDYFYESYGEPFYRTDYPYARPAFIAKLKELFH